MMPPVAGLQVLQEYVTMADFVSATILGYDTCLLEGVMPALSVHPLRKCLSWAYGAYSQLFPTSYCFSASLPI